MKKIKRLLMVLTLLVLTYTPVVMAASNSCPLGEHVTKDLNGALKIFRIVAPLLLLGLTIIDLIKLVSSGLGDGKEATPKQIAMRFAKRLGATVLLFIIPTLVDIVFQWAGIWNEDGNCMTTLNNEARVVVDNRPLR